MADFIAKQVASDRERKGGMPEDKPEYTELKRLDDQKIHIGLSLSSQSLSQTPQLQNSKVFKSSSSFNSKEKSEKSGEKRKAPSNLSQIMEQEIMEKKKAESSKKTSEKPWLMPGIHVKIVTKSLGDKYYKQKGHVKTLADDYTAVVVVASTGAKVKLDQSHLETVIPAIGRTVKVLRGKSKGEDGILKTLNVEEFSAVIELKNGDKITLLYEHFSKKYE